MRFRFSFLISGLSSVDRKTYGKIGFRAFRYCMVTTLIAAFTGVVVTVLLQPGKPSRYTAVTSGGNAEAVHTVDAFLYLIRYVSNSSQENYTGNVLNII